MERAVYNYHRYYDPQTGRYVTSDPIGLEGGLNTYGYVKANPLRLIDILGLFDLDGGNVVTDPKELEDIRKRIQAGCDKLLDNIEDTGLKTCIKKRCDGSNEVIFTTDRCEGKVLAYNKRFFWIPSSTVYFCPRALQDKDKICAAAIHEFAHTCGWDHNEGKGVPGNDGVTRQSDAQQCCESEKK